MAQAVKSTIEKVVTTTTTEPAIVLTLSVPEARALLSMTRNVNGGDLYATLIEPIGQALVKAGIRAPMGLTGGTSLKYGPNALAEITGDNFSV